MNCLLNAVTLHLIARRNFRGKRAQRRKLAAGGRHGFGGFEGFVHGTRYFHIQQHDDACYYHAPGANAQVMRKKSKKSGIEDQLRKKVAASLANPRKSIAASKVFKRLRAIHSAAIRNASS
ncbi:MAG: hypothetical protein QOD89_2441 [Bradyrhizobium sp.]|nr:hypothetical protein [Bradyrhizobium sp.]